ncbi:hypothetical protein EHQ58_00980 [Leptospira ognonensis]|uniref:Uncharacterized protein n=1 Tax=Leptospira ognonensis TaxID=2484945 RepID=A0A4R9KAP1_9LEPT|nr:DUF5677 domain-containing protein [Leptospira ognonensis]TGL63767.1 hypothetical protein EHQ58_00980 [Leptospira ognonensis]
MKDFLDQLNPPIITEELISDCRKDSDFRPILFEHYKYTGILANILASFSLDSPAVRKIPKIHYAVLTGLLNRCSRLILSNIHLSQGGLFGETTLIIDRCIFESAIKIEWLTSDLESEKFNRYLADGLKTDIEFKKEIEASIKKRGGGILQIENRMLQSINRRISHSGMTETEILNTKKVPNTASIIELIGKTRLYYVIGQRIGSHHVHGTWQSLLMHYLEEIDDNYILRDHNCSTHINQFFYIETVVLNALISFSKYIFEQENEAKIFTNLISQVIEDIKVFENEIVGEDFNFETAEK